MLGTWQLLLLLVVKIRNQLFEIGCWFYLFDRLLDIQLLTLLFLEEVFLKIHLENGAKHFDVISLKVVIAVTKDDFKLFVNP